MAVLKVTRVYLMVQITEVLPEQLIIMFKFGLNNISQAKGFPLLQINQK
jgi:hypothetical protein